CVVESGVWDDGGGGTGCWEDDTSTSSHCSRGISHSGTVDRTKLTVWTPCAYRRARESEWVARNRPARRRLSRISQLAHDAPPSYSRLADEGFLLPGARIRGIRSERTNRTASTLAAKAGVRHPDSRSCRDAAHQPTPGRPRAGHRRPVGGPRTRGTRGRHGIRHSRRRDPARLRPALRFAARAPRARPP